MIDKIVEAYDEETFLKADGFDEAVIGVDDKSMRLIYSVSKCYEILMKDGMDYDSAVEYFEFNTKSAYVGEKNTYLV